jgi:hypothetical protein
MYLFSFFISKRYLKMNYDIVIVGGGPSGLALAQCCSFIGKKVLIIERENDIGGCHRVRRIKSGDEFLFNEHGPRIYSSTYKVFITLLKKMDLDFYDLFVPYKFNITTIGKESIWTALTFGELFILFSDFIALLINDNYGKDISMKEHLINLEFSEKSKDMIDRICRLTDGANSSNYTLHQFLQLLNQQFFYGLYQPREPTDIGLLKKWRDYLEKNGVTFLLNASVEDINVEENNNNIQNIIIKKDDQKSKVSGEKYILAIPPKSIVSLIKNNELIKDAFGDFNTLEKWSEKCAYIDYITVSFHWDTKLILPSIYGFPKSEWGLAFIVLSDYMSFNEKKSKTVISASVTIKENNSKRIGKKIDECTKEELIEEIFYQLSESFGGLKTPSEMILSPGVININNEWKCIDTAFVATSKEPNLSFNSTFDNLYNVGTHNGQTLYNFTSLEAAVTNAVSLSHSLYPELKEEFHISSTITVRQIVWFCFFLILISIISKKNI